MQRYPAGFWSKHFVEHGLDISYRKLCALESSLEHGQLDVYKYLIERIGFTPKLLYEQVTLRKSLRNGKVCDRTGRRKRPRKEKFALKAACIGGHIEIVKYLIERSAQKLVGYNLLLIYSASYGQEEASSNILLVSG